MCGSLWSAVVEWIAHTLHQTHGGSAGIRVAPFYGRWVRGKVVSFAGNPGTGRTGGGALGAFSLGSLPLAAQSRVCGRPDAPQIRSPYSASRAMPVSHIPYASSDGYYEVHKQVCIDSRRSRLLWGSGNARQNRMGTSCEAGTGFPNPDSANVGVLENRWVTVWKPSESPTASTGRDA